MDYQVNKSNLKVYLLCDQSLIQSKFYYFTIYTNSEKKLSKLKLSRKFILHNNNNNAKELLCFYFSIFFLYVMNLLIFQNPSKFLNFVFDFEKKKSIF